MPSPTSLDEPTPARYAVTAAGFEQALTKIDGVAATALLAPFVNQLLTSIDFPNSRR
jgi:hypothetical protein